MELLIALQENPNSTFSSLAKQLDISVQTVSARYDKLWNHYYPPEEENPIPEFYQGLVKAEFNNDSLGMELLDILLEVHGKQKFVVLYQVLSQFPYIIYQVQIFGAFNGIHAQFRIPQETIHHVDTFLNHLIQEDLISSFKIYKSSTNDTITTLSSLSIWMGHKKRWIFDWKVWTENFLDYSSKHHIPSRPEVDRMIKPLDHLDIRILRFLNVDYRKKNIDLLASLVAEDISEFYVQNKLKIISINLDEEAVIRAILETYNIEVLDDYLEYSGEVIAPSAVVEFIKKKALLFQSLTRKQFENITSDLEASSALWSKIEQIYPPQRLSERIIRLKQTFISNLRVQLSESMFDMFQTLLYRSRCPPDVVEKLGGLLEYSLANPENYFPFYSIFKPLEDGFMWYLRIPPAYFNEVNHLLWNFGVEDLDIFLVDYKSSQIYTLFYYTWDVKAEQLAKKSNPNTTDLFWKKDEKFMVTDVIHKVRPIIKWFKKN